jgi:hypothetical protein
MANTFELIASSTVGSGGTANITFSSIPSTFTDLCVKASIRLTGADDYFLIQFNSSSSSYTVRVLEGSGSAASSGSNTILYARATKSTQTASTFGSAEIYVPNYAGSTNKSLSIDSTQENNATASNMTLSAGLWSNTSAITSISLIQPGGMLLAEYSTAYLYGVKNA